MTSTTTPAPADVLPAGFPIGTRPAGTMPPPPDSDLSYANLGAILVGAGLPVDRVRPLVDQIRTNTQRAVDTAVVRAIRDTVLTLQVNQEMRTEMLRQELELAGFLGFLGVDTAKRLVRRYLPTENGR